MIDYTTYRYEYADDIVVLEVSGNLDSQTSEFLLDCVQGHIEEGLHKFVFDCSTLDYISSMGLGTLIRANSRLKKSEGAIALAGVEGIVAEAIHLVRFDSIFGLYPTVDEAAEALR